MTEDIILKTEKINKWFGVTHANCDIDFQLRRGEIRGLIGENGSGKSTFTSQLCGILAPTSGKMYLNGEEYAPKSPLEANQKRVAMVVQELGVLGTLPVSINMFMGHTQPYTHGGFLDTKAMNKAAEESLKRYGFGNIPLNALAQDLSIEQRKLVELTKALIQDPEILVLDEVTQALSHDNRTILYKIMDNFVKVGHSIVMISHDLEETLELCDSITVLRDGHVIKTIQREDFDLDEMKRLMIGREMDQHYYREDQKESHDEKVVLSVKDLCTDKLKDVSFDLHAGEILGVCGLSDGGIHDLGRTLFAKEKIRKGQIVIHTPKGEKVVKKSRDLINNHGAYLSKDRDSEGLMLQASVALNLQVPSLKMLAGPLGFVNPKRERKMAQNAKEAFGIKCESIDAPVNSMSGGNKQKVNLSRWLLKSLDFIILDCPTRGVDVGVKSYIYQVLENEAKEKKRAILLISDELPEVMGMSDRLLVMKDGKIASVLSRTDGFTTEKIMEVMI